MRSLVASLLFLTLTTFAACGDDDTDPPVNAPPVLEILAPADGNLYLHADTITLEASATDPEDGVLAGESLAWSSDLDGALGTGPTLSVDDLSFGVHRITATASDSEGLTDSAAVTVEVSALLTAATWMTGAFNSEQQSIDDPTYLHITLHMARIWPDSTHGVWIYVEQAVAGQDPYRQRVYRLFEEAGQVQDEIYALPDEASWVGAWETPSDFETMHPAELALKGGCEVYFDWIDGRFEGGTEGQGCSSSLNGASYATTDILLEPALLTSWDQGWTSGGDQVWGPTAGPYLFDKIEDFPID